VVLYLSDERYLLASVACWLEDATLADLAIVVQDLGVWTSIDVSVWTAVCVAFIH
jgi:hypothetical protein